MRLRVSIRALMAFVILAGVVFAAWRIATPLWSSVVFNLTVLALLIASYNARYSHGAVGAWWFGFALCGWAYLVLTLATSEVNSIFRFLETPLDHLLEVSLAYSGNYLFDPDRNSPSADLANRSRYLIMKCVLTFPNALVGAVLCRIVATRREARATT